MPETITDAQDKPNAPAAEGTQPSPQGADKKPEFVYKTFRSWEEVAKSAEEAHGELTRKSQELAEAQSRLALLVAEKNAQKDGNREVTQEDIDQAEQKLAEEFEADDGTRKIARTFRRYGELAEGFAKREADGLRKELEVIRAKLEEIAETSDQVYQQNRDKVDSIAKAFGVSRRKVMENLTLFGSPQIAQPETGVPAGSGSGRSAKATARPSTYLSPEEVAAMRKQGVQITDKEVAELNAERSGGSNA